MNRKRIHERRIAAMADDVLVQVMEVNHHLAACRSLVSDHVMLFDSSEDAEQLGPLYAVYSGMMHSVEGNRCYLKE